MLKLKILLVAALGVAGIASSLALADGGHHSKRDAAPTTQCQRVPLWGTAGPQTLTVTVTRSGKHSPYAPGQVVTLAIGGSGDTVHVLALGCANGSTVNARGAMLNAFTKHPVTVAPPTTTDGKNGKGKDHDGHHHTTTTSPVTTTVVTTTVATTTTNSTTTNGNTTTTNG